MALQDNKFLDKSEIASVIYHNIFDYPLTSGELKKWKVGKTGLLEFKNNILLRKTKGDFSKRKLRGEVSEIKIQIAQKASILLSKIPTVEGVFLTGALAMKNADNNSDIDLMIITKVNTLWITRLISYLVIWLLGYKIRKPNDRNQKDKLCLNIWLDESALSWSKNDRNIYSAHEIAQIKPILDKDYIHQRFLQKNVWILDYWPNAVHIERIVNKQSLQTPPKLIERLAFKIQHLYMKSKITSEKITLHKAIFHPRDWGGVVIKRLSS